MASKVAGLTPVPEDRRRPTERLSTRSRTTPASAIKAKGLSPSAQPVDAYARPAQEPAGSNGWEGLAKALSDIQPSINQFIEVSARKKSQPLDADYAESRRQLSLIGSPEERAKAIRDGKIPALQSLAGREVAAERLAYDQSVKMLENFDTEFDPSSGNVEDYILSHTKDDLERFKGDPVFMGVYTKQMSSFADKLREQAANKRAALVTDTREGDVFGKWASKSTYDLAEGAAPADVAANVFGDFKKNKELLRIPFDKQQEMALQLADQAATRGDYDYAKALLEHQRDDGPYKGSLLTDAKVGGKANDLFARIDTQQTRARLAAQSAEDEESLYSEGVKAAEQGSVLSIGDAQIRDKQGELKTISADAQKKEIGNRLVKKAAEEAAYRTSDPKQRPALARQIEKDMFVGSGLEHPVWFKAMNGAPGQVNLNATTGKISPSAMDAYQTYQDLYKDSPQYLNKFLNKDSLEFFENARMAEEMGNAGTPEEALRIAHAVTMDPNQMPEAMKLKYESIDSAVNTAVSNSQTWGDWWAGKGQAGNSNYARTEIVRSAKQYALLGMDNDEAISKAQETFSKTHLNVAGSFIKNDKRLPGDFEPLVMDYLKDFVEKHKDKYQFDMDDLTIGQASNGVGGYMIVRKSDRMPAAPAENDMYFSLNNLNDLRQQHRDQKIDEVTKRWGR